MRKMGLVFDVYEKPPHPFFWIFDLLSPVTEHEKLFDVPLVWVFASADRRVKERSSGWQVE